MSADNCCKSIAVFTMFPGFCLNKLQQLFSDSSKGNACKLREPVREPRNQK